MQIIGIFLGFIILIFITYRNWSVYLATFLASAVVILFSGLPLIQTLTQSYIGGIGAIFSSLLGMFMFSSVMAKLYAVSGAASSISLTLCNTFLKKNQSEGKKQTLGLLIVIFASALMCYGGINAAIVIITIYPISLIVFEQCDIPKRFIPGVILGGSVTFALSGPGVPQPTNMIPMQILETPSYAGLIPGIIGMIVEIVVIVGLLNYIITKARKSGEHFSYGTKDIVVATDNKYPSFWIALIPLVTLFIMFNVFELDIMICTLISSLVSLILFYPYLEKSQIKSHVNDGFVSALLPVGSIGAVFGFATVVQEVPAFQSIVNSIIQLDINPYLLSVIAVAFLCSLTGGSTTGQAIVLPIIRPILEGMGMTPLVLHRIAAFSATTIDSLPHSGTILMTVNHTDLKMKDAYPSIFITTTLATIAGTSVVTLLLYFFPGLA
jgi:H+/gluconate symporter-like permease